MGAAEHGRSAACYQEAPRRDGLRRGDRTELSDRLRLLSREAIPLSEFTEVLRRPNSLKNEKSHDIFLPPLRRLSCAIEPAQACPRDRESPHRRLQAMSARMSRVTWLFFAERCWARTPARYRYVRRHVCGATLRPGARLEIRKTGG